MSAQVLICKFAVFTCVSYFFYRCRTWLAWLAGSQFVKTQKQSYVSVSLVNTSDPWHLYTTEILKFRPERRRKSATSVSTYKTIFFQWEPVKTCTSKDEFYLNENWKKFPSYRRLCLWPQFGLALKRGPRPTRKWSHMISLTWLELRL